MYFKNLVATFLYPLASSTGRMVRMMYDACRVGTFVSVYTPGRLWFSTHVKERFMFRHHCARRDEHIYIGDNWFSTGVLQT